MLSSKQLRGGRQDVSLRAQQGRHHHAPSRPTRARPSCVSALRFFSKVPGTGDAPALAIRFAPLLLPSRPTPTSVTYAAEATDTSALADKKDGASRFGRIKFQGVHHVGLLCENLERSLAFYKDILGLEENPDRPHHKLPYRGAWLWIGPEMIHLMELPDPDPKNNRPEHGGRDRHFCVGVADVQPLIQRLEAGNVTFTKSMSGRPAVFFRDPDMNCLEVAEMGEWR